MRIDYQHCQFPDRWVFDEMGRRVKLNYGKSQAAVRAEDGDIPIYGTGGLMEYGKCSLSPGDSVLIGRKGTLDNPLYIGSPFWAVDTTYYTSEFDGCTKWLYYLVQTVGLANLNEATGVPSLARETFYRLRAPFPPKPQQSKIAEVLSTVDWAIEQTEALIAKYQRIKTGLMQDLLTRGIDEHGRLRGSATHKFKPSPLGPIPAQWDAKLLPAVASYQNGKAFPSSDFQDSGVPLLRPGNMHVDGGLVWDSAHTVCLAEKWLSEASNFIVRDAELVVNLTAQSLDDQFLGRVCLTPPGTLCLLNQRVARFKASACYLPFLFWVLKGPHFRWHVDQIPQGTKVKHIYNSNLDAALIAVPREEDEQKLIARVLFSASGTIENEQVSLGKLQHLKTGLMQDLLTGKVSVEHLLETQSAR
jgi:type I restriction enzyme S subunit